MLLCPTCSSQPLRFELKSTVQVHVTPCESLDRRRAHRVVIPITIMPAQCGYSHLQSM